jgi:hypothetical protein
MPISPGEAAAALTEVAETQARSSRAWAYQQASLPLFLWGVIWAAGYGLMGVLAPDDWWKIWLPGDVVGFGGTLFLLARGRTAARRAGSGPLVLRFLALLVVMALFFAAARVAFQPASMKLVEAFPAFVVGLMYVLIGTFGLARYIAVGAAMFALGGAAAVFPQALTMFWMAAAGGAVLILGGLWMRRA